MDALIEAAWGLVEAWDPVLEGDSYLRCLLSFKDFVLDLDLWRDDVEDLLAVKASDVTPLDFTKPWALRQWLVALDDSISDAVDAGDDATLPPGRRVLGRATAREHILDARHSLRCLLEAANRGAPPVPEPPGEGGGGGGAG
jgi:hypothetical protein